MQSGGMLARRIAALHVACTTNVIRYRQWAINRMSVKRTLLLPKLGQHP